MLSTRFVRTSGNGLCHKTWSHFLFAQLLEVLWWTCLRYDFFFLMLETEELISEVGSHQILQEASELSWLFFFWEFCDFCHWQPRFEIMWVSVQITYLVENTHRWRFERGDILSCIQHFVKIKPLIRKIKVSYLVSLENGILVPTELWCAIKRGSGNLTSQARW